MYSFNIAFSPACPSLPFDPKGLMDGASALSYHCSIKRTNGHNRYQQITWND